VEAERRRILVTGATGKVGQAFIRRTLAADVGQLAGLTVRALCHNRVLDAAPRLEIANDSDSTFVSNRVGCIVLRPFFDLTAACLEK